MKKVEYKIERYLLYAVLFALLCPRTEPSTAAGIAVTSRIQYTEEGRPDSGRGSRDRRKTANAYIAPAARPEITGRDVRRTAPIPAASAPRYRAHKEKGMQRIHGLSVPAAAQVKRISRTNIAAIPAAHPRRDPAGRESRFP